MEGRQAQLYLKSRMLTGVISFTKQPHIVLQAKNQERPGENMAYKTDSSPSTTPLAITESSQRESYYKFSSILGYTSMKERKNRVDDDLPGSVQLFFLETASNFRVGQRQLMFELECHQIYPQLSLLLVQYTPFLHK
jgi:hypothetical protein